jgi:tetratricopeptide (TPR) repeat protein
LAVPAGAQAILILPFENHSRNSALDWIGESAAEGLAAHWRLPPRPAATGETRYVIRREERVAAFDQLGLPPAIELSHASVIKIGELAGADLVVLGSFEGDAEHLTLSARVLEMRTPRLQPPCQEQGRLADLLGTQDRLSMDLAADLAASAGFSGASGNGVGTSSLETWELYIRGLTAGPSPQQFKYFREAMRLDPGFLPAAFQLGRISFQSRDYSDAIQWLEKLGTGDPNYLEASFLTGISAYHLRQWEKAEAAFLAVIATLPLNEAFNNLGIAQLRQRKRAAALENLQKAVEGDPNDADYAYNLACYYLRAGDSAQAARRLREVLALKPGDTEAKALLANLLQENPSDPPERLKYNFEEPNFRQLQMTLERMAEEKDGGELPAGTPSLAALHLSRGRQLAGLHEDTAAAREFNEAIQLDPSSVQAHLDLARLHLRAARFGPAEECTQRAVELDRDKKDPEPYLLLARIYQDQGKADQAREALQQALERDPDNVAAREFERQLKVKPQ